MFQMLGAIYRSVGDSSYKIPSVSQVLSSIALPSMAEAMHAEEAEAKSEAFIENLKRLAARTGGDFKFGD